MKKILILIFILSFSLLSPTLYSQDNNNIADTWTKIAEPTRIAETIHYLFSHPQGLFARSVLGRVLKYDFKDQEWKSFEQGLLPASSSILFPEKDKLYAGTAAGIFVSDGKINNWKMVGTGTQPHNPFGLAKSAGKFYAVAREGVYSFNGKSWVILSDAIGEVSKLRAWAMDDSGIFVAGENGLYFYDQKNRNWKNISFNLEKTNFEEAVQDVYLQKGVLYLALDKLGVMTKEINASEWKSLNLGLPENPKVRSFSQPYQSPMVYLEKDQFVLSKDGKTWKNANLNTPAEIHSIVDYKGTLYAAGEKGNYKQSKNSWTAINSGLKTEAISDFRNINEKLYASSITGLYQFDKDSSTWKALLGGVDIDCRQPIEQIRALDNKTYLGTYLSGVVEADFQNDIWKSAGKGWPLQKLSPQTMQQLKKCIPIPHQSVPFMGTYNHQLVAATPQSAFRLINQTWTPWFDVKKFSKEPKDRILGIQELDDAFFVGTLKGLYRYSSANPQWKKLDVLGSTDAFVTHFTRDRDHLYFESNNEKIYSYDKNTQSINELASFPTSQNSICEIKNVRGELWALGAKGVYSYSKQNNEWKLEYQSAIGEAYCPAVSVTNEAIYLLKKDGLYKRNFEQK